MGQSERGEVRESAVGSRAVSRARLLLLASLLLTSACGGESTAPPSSPKPPLSSGASLEPYFPLDDGKLYHYVTKEGDDSGMLVAKASRKDATHGELRLSNGTKRFVYLPDGVAYDGGAYILKAPVEVGTSWLGEHGGTTRIAATDVAVSVPAGSYAACVRTVEEGGRSPGARYETTYCPGVGMVLLVVAAGGHEARAELKSYGQPVKIE
ncbi:MAG: hypothetical protein BGO98_23550 [Myxococcales bacterium 68-20]|nr:MAG: hypothetical protein BGO98_23550 [Myxococcales bacterium 68-20]